MKLIVGLGNPGSEYRRTRHNIGFDVIERLRDRHAGSRQQKFKGEIGRARIGDDDCLLLCPLTYMNRSGISVALAREYFGIPTTDLIVVHDEVDFSFGQVRIKVGGGAAGHKGIRSIIESLGTPDFVRVRMGIGRPERGDMSSHVLSRWNTDEADWLDGFVGEGADTVEEILARGVKAATQRLHSPPSQKD